MQTIKIYDIDYDEDISVVAEECLPEKIKVKVEDSQLIERDTVKQLIKEETNYWVNNFKYIVCKHV